MKENYISKKLKINGIVQGVGFRPFVYNLANKFRLKGEVANTSSGVSIHIEGAKENIESFCSNLLKNHPPLAHLSEISFNEKPVEYFKNFSIVNSRSRNLRSTLISPDVSVCDDCLSELFDPDDRRYQYPFINCTNCGPRYTIINDIPYDRPNTSMKDFKMCAKCKAEYDDPSSRRFHAQPNACADCGPHVSLKNNTGKNIQSNNPIEKTASLLRKGYIIAIKGIGGFHLAADATNNDAVVRLRKRKHREEKPFAVMSYGLKQIREYAFIESEEEKLLNSIQKPVVLLRKKEANLLSREVSPNNRYFGVMLAYTPLHYLILDFGFTALIMTSGNISEEPMAIDNEDAFNRLGNIADYFLIHNRDIYLRSDDSIIRRTAGKTRFIRRSRGYVPVPVFLKSSIPQILACGAELKNTVCLTKEKTAFISQHIGDLENLATDSFFRLIIDHSKRILDINPEIIACDLHPDYLSTRYAEEQHGVKLIQVQHHHAHIASCMTENKLDSTVIGLSFDGTGYGTDGCIWGGEILIVEPARFRRAASFSYVSMPGSAAAIKEPWRMAVSYLYHAFGEEFWNLDLPLLKEIEEKNIKIIVEMISKKINSPLTSSLGRLFDGIAAIIGIRNNVSFEGQAAMELEMLADSNSDDIYNYEWLPDDTYKVLTQPIVCGVVKDMKAGIHSSRISSKFHMTLVKLFSELCEVIRKENGLNRIVLSGGVFQNSILLRGLIKALEEKRFEVYTHSKVPTNDGGISLGQAVVAAAIAKR
ncbi:MAG: carbamoyltransferase HypF [Deltaproteobacteria bacterium]|jgi:hydrogenase maturation protein HypF|nr:carbamoyltransferase HypF [Deltaproteobacteria bacterium]